MSITNYQFTASHLHSIEAVPIASGGVTLVKNLGPSTVYLGDSGNGSTLPPGLISATFGYPLAAGESIQFAGITSTNWLTFNTAADPDELGNTHTAVVRVMVVG